MNEVEFMMTCYGLEDILLSEPCITYTLHIDTKMAYYGIFEIYIFTVGSNAMLYWKEVSSLFFHSTSQSLVLQYMPIECI